MPAKRGRPISNDTTDVTTLAKRAQQRERVRAYRERAQAAHAVNNPFSQAQQRQAIVVIQTPINTFNVAPTISQLGLRLQGLTIAQDFANIPEQEDTITVDDQQQLYPINSPQTTSPSVTQPSSSSHSDSSPRHDISWYFRNVSRRSSILTTQRSSPTISTTQNNATTEIPTRPSSRQTDIQQHIGSTSPIYYADSEDAINDQDGVVNLQFDDSDVGPHAVVDGDELSTLLPQHDSTDSSDAPSQTNLEPPAHENHVDGTTLDAQLEIDDSEDSDNFVPQSTASSHEEEESEPVITTATKLLDQLQDENFHGCTPDAHADALASHLATSVNEAHYGLLELWDPAPLPSRLSQQQVLSPDVAANTDRPTAGEWQSTFCGTENGGAPRQACLHVEQTQQVEPTVAFDIDSYLGFASSLAVARQGIMYQPIPLAKQNVQTDVHVQVQAEGGGEADVDTPPVTRPTPIKDVPHIFLGRVVGATDITIHVLFPHLRAHGDTNYLTQQEHSTWFDDIFNPALYSHYPAHVTQHLPASHRHALANSRARQVEHRIAGGQGYETQQAIAHFLAPDGLMEVWERVQAAGTEPGYRQFREPQLYFSAKGTKLQFKTNTTHPTLLSALQRFNQYITGVLDFDFVHTNRFFVDVGKETCPQVSFLSAQSVHFDDQAQVYLWKRCCLESCLKWLHNDTMPKSGVTWYNVALLRDACNVTCQQSTQSLLRAGGLIYSQFYSSYKEVIDAAKSYPFQNDGLEELCLDPQIRKTANHLAGGRRRQVDVVTAAYQASKKRLLSATDDSKLKSFGLREEHRISWALFQQMLTMLTLRDDQTVLILDDAPSHAWAVQTPRFLSFLARSADKFTSAFEWVAATADSKCYTWEETKIMAMFLRCLRFCLASHDLRRESALWWSRRDRPARNGASARTWYGLGMSNTVTKYGYGWIEPRVDWETLSFQAQYTDQMLFGNANLKNQYLRRGGAVRDFFDTTRRIEFTITALVTHKHSSTISRALLLHLIHVCLQQFRIDTVASLRDVNEAHRQAAQEGMDIFSLDYFRNILTSEPHLVSGNRSGTVRPVDVFNRLYGPKASWPRPNWEDKPFRAVYHRVLSRLNRDLPIEFKQWFEGHFRRAFFGLHWLLPYPAVDGFANYHKNGKRLWFSIRPTEETDIVVGDQHINMSSKIWERAKDKAYQTEQPPEIPINTTWTREQWQEWIANHGGTQ